MFIIQVQGLSAGDRQLPAGIPPRSLASISSGSSLDQVVIDARVLGIGGVVPVSSSSTIDARARSRMSDADGAYETIRDANGDVAQVHDVVELCIWEPGEVPVPCQRRANAVMHVAVPFDAIPLTPISELNARRVMRAGCAGRQYLTVWVGQPSLNPASVVEVRLRLRRAGLWSFSSGGPGSAPNLLREVDVPVNLGTSLIYSSMGVCTPQTFDITGAAEFELYLGANDASDGAWQVSVELEDPR